MFFLAFRNFLLPYILPFIIAYLLSLISRPVVKFFDSAGITRVITAIVCTIFIYFGIGSVIYFVLKCLFVQIYDFSKSIIEAPEAFFTSFWKIYDGICAKYPRLFKLIDIEPVKETFLEKLTGYAGIILEKTAEIAINVPNFLLFLFATVFSTYYFIKSYKKTDFSKYLPKSICAVIFYCKNLFLKYLRHYLTSMVIMLLIVFCILLLGFWLLDFQYFLLIAFVVAIIDMLPILGVGTILVPWGVYYFFVGNYSRGFWLIFMYVSILFIRQIIEPKLIGNKVGISPFVTLVLVYIGFRAFGIAGVIFAPFIAMIVTSIYKDLHKRTP